MSSIIGSLLALACILFTVSLPIGKTAAGRTLRQWAIACFLAAIVPSVACSIFHQASAGGPGGAAGGDVLGLLGGVAVLSVLAYAVLKIRARFTRPTRDAWSELVGQRSSGKRLADDRERPRRDEPFPL